VMYFKIKDLQGLQRGNDGFSGINNQWNSRDGYGANRAPVIPKKNPLALNLCIFLGKQ
jgi:hypothetical protein